MAKRIEDNNRRKLIEEQRKKMRSKERRTTILTIVISSVIGIALIASAVYFGQKERNQKDEPLRTIGVAAEAAGCTEVKEEKIPKEAEDDAVKHTPRNGDRVEYPNPPPTSGRHNPTPLPVGAKKFYSRDDNQPPERAVHNMEHGYVVVWYDNKATDEQLDVLKTAADNAEGKFLFMPWTRQDFADDKHIVLTAWSFKQQCSDVSGAVIQEFFDKHGGKNGVAPEKGAI